VVTPPWSIRHLRRRLEWTRRDRLVEHQVAVVRSGTVVTLTAVDCRPQAGALQDGLDRQVPLVRPTDVADLTDALGLGRALEREVTEAEDPAGQRLVDGDVEDPGDRLVMTNRSSDWLSAFQPPWAASTSATEIGSQARSSGVLRVAANTSTAPIQSKVVSTYTTQWCRTSSMTCSPSRVSRCLTIRGSATLVRTQPVSETAIG